LILVKTKEVDTLVLIKFEYLISGIS